MNIETLTEVSVAATRPVPPRLGELLLRAGKLTPRFIERVSESLAAKGLKAGGWSDGMGHTETAAMPQAVQTNISDSGRLNATSSAGEVRIKEMVANVYNQFKYFEKALAPLALFDITGKLTAELFAFRRDHASSISAPGLATPRRSAD